AELAAGGPDSPQSFAIVSVSSAGIAAAIVLDGKLLRGVNGAAGEIAYLPADASLPSLGPRNTVVDSLGPLVSSLVRKDPPIDRLVGPITHAVATLCAVIDPGRVILAGALARERGEPLSTAVENSLAA